MAVTCVTALQLDRVAVKLRRSRVAVRLVPLHLRELGATRLGRAALGLPLVSKSAL
jgi:hypothetical protein